MRLNSLGGPIPAAAEGHWRQIRILHPSNTWRPPPECARLILVLQQRPQPHRFRSPCVAGLPNRGGGPGVAPRPGRAGLHPESEATWDRGNERPILLRSETTLRTDRRKTVACALAKPIPRPSLFLSGRG